MKKRYIVIPAAMLLFACTYLRESRLSEQFARDRVYGASKNFINRLNGREYESCYQSFNQAMRASMSLNRLQNTLDSVLNSLGRFVRFKGISASEKTVLGEDYAVCTVKCVYENGPATFTISLDKDLKIGGLYIK